MRPSSRDYSITTSSLDPTKPKTWLLRAVPVIYEFLLRLMRDRKDAARCFRDKVKVTNLRPFIAQHLVWALQLLGIVEYVQEWAWTSLRYYTSTRNTLKLFKRFRVQFGESKKIGDAENGGTADFQRVRAFKPHAPDAVTDTEAGEFMNIAKST